MSKSAVNISYAQSLLWVALFMAVMCGVINIVHLLFVDFVHGNPHRTQGNALSMMVEFTLILGVIAVIGTFLVFALPQFFQAALIGALGQIFGDRAQFAALLALPLTAVITWYCYDYLTPTDFNLGINVDPDWTPFKHGLSVSRYITTLIIQTPITLFSFLYFNAGLRDRSKKPVLLAALAVTVVVGGIWGYTTARDQYQFL